MSNLLSICIPTFNRFKHLDETLNNITNLSQSYNFVNEILIIDNNECNKASKIVSQYSQRFKKIKYIKNEKNIGPENNFKKCILSAESQYVWIIADDDLIFTKLFPITFPLT